MLKILLFLQYFTLNVFSAILQILANVKICVALQLNAHMTVNIVILIYNIIITMARQPSIGAWASSFRGYEVFVHFAAVRDRPTAALFNSIMM